MKKIILLLCLVLLSVGGYFWWNSKEALSSTTSPKTPSIYTVSRAPLLVTVEATGSVEPEQEVEIKCKASGEVVKIPVDISDIVKKGALLLQLDPENEERSVQKAKVNLTVSEAKLSQAKLELQIGERNLVSDRLRAEATLESADASEKEAASRLQRLHQLREKKMASEEELDTGKANAAQARAALKTAQAGIEDVKTSEVNIASLGHAIRIAEQQVESDRIALDDAEESLEETTVTAPIDGVVAEQNVQVGQIIASGVSNVSGGTTIMTLADLSRMYVLVSVDESDIGRIQLGQAATVTVDAYPSLHLPGKVMRIATKGTLSANVVTFEVKVEVTSKKKRLLKPAMTANVDITVVDNPHALIVPVKAVVEREKGAFVTLFFSDGRTEKRKVITGESDGKVIEILSGLSEKDTISIANKTEGKWEKSKSNTSEKKRRGPMGPPL